MTSMNQDFAEGVGLRAALSLEPLFMSTRDVHCVVVYANVEIKFLCRSDLSA